MDVPYLPPLNLMPLNALTAGMKNQNKLIFAQQ
jgi:hypothetical protein